MAILQMKRLTLAVIRSQKEALLKELIDHIEVSEVEGKGKNRRQRIVIHYRFAGYIDLEENYVESNFKQDTRQGVAVEYVPRAAGE